MSSYVMSPYDEALQEILDNGVSRTNKRTGIKTLSIFGMNKRYRIDGRFPIVTRRKVWPQSIFAELLWFLSGSTNNNDLLAMNSKIWSSWVDDEFCKKHGYAQGSFGPVYGFQLRHFGGYYGNGIGGRESTDKPYVKVLEHLPPPCEGMQEVEKNQYGKGGFDQLTWMVNRVKEDPSCRRLLFSLWNPAEVSKMKLPPCHYTFQLFIDDEGRMSGMLTQRSCDFPI
jgi:thymidylate synthase